MGFLENFIGGLKGLVGSKPISGFSPSSANPNQLIVPNPPRNPRVLAPYIPYKAYEDNIPARSLRPGPFSSARPLDNP